jgi:hypothetical protein
MHAQTASGPSFSLLAKRRFVSAGRLEIWPVMLHRARSAQVITISNQCAPSHSIVGLSPYFWVGFSVSVAAPLLSRVARRWSRGELFLNEPFYPSTDQGMSARTKSLFPSAARWSYVRFTSPPKPRPIEASISYGIAVRTAVGV